MSSGEFAAATAGQIELESALERSLPPQRGGLLLAFLTFHCRLGRRWRSEERHRLQAERAAFRLTYLPVLRPWWDRLLLNPQVEQCLWEMRRLSWLEALVPELLDGEGLEQSVVHPDDVLGHNLRTCSLVPPRLRLRLAALLHDVGKPGYYIEHPVMGRRFPGHQRRSGYLVPEILTRLGYPRPMIDGVQTLVCRHMFIWTPEQGEEPVRDHLALVGRELAWDWAELVAADRRAIWGEQAEEVNNCLKDAVKSALSET